MPKASDRREKRVASVDGGEGLPARRSAERPRADILVVEDKVENLRLLSQMLSRAGYKVRPVTNGPGALAAARSTPPDLVLLDIVMPGMDGYEVCRHLKAEETTADVPIIFISALDAAEDKVRAFAAGGVDYITKPFQAEEVLARVSTHLNLRSLQKSLEREVAELDAFAHTVAHDLKDPLSSIIVSSDYLANYGAELDAAEQTQFLRRINQLAYEAVTIVDELLLLAGVRKGRVERLPVDMEVAVRHSLGRLESMIEEYGGQIVLPPAWPIVLGHAPWVEEVWVNYLSNGLKYGGRPPRLELGITPQADDKARFWVRDNGQGLTPQEQAVLFAEFTRITQVQIEGHGLGLSIVRRIVEKLGGSVGVQS
ncbi:MAG: response regulator, partial [Anaerolineae bacterium]